MNDETQKPKTGLLDEDTFESSLHGSADDSHDVTQPLSVTKGFEADPHKQDKSIPMDAEIVGNSTPPSWIGRRLGNFKLLRLLGKGAMGLVIQAQDVNLGRIVALKVLRKQIRGMDDEQKVQQFLREAKAIARIEHPNVAHIYQIDSHEGWWYIASEFIEGGSVRDVVRAAGPLTPARACPITADAAAALLAVHHVGMIHRDVKPSNIMLTRTGRAKLVDFGLVRMDDPNDPFDFHDQTIGTPHYMPPELVRHEPATAASDVYSLGATLYYTLTGKPPFEADDMQEVLRQHVQDPRPDVHKLAPLCSESLAKLIQRMMAIKQEDRPTVTEVQGALRAENIGAAPGDSSIVIDPDSLAVLSRSEPDRSSLVLNTSTTAAPRRRKPWLLAILAAAVVVLLAVVFFDIDIQRVASPTADRVAFTARFPEAPTSYGQRPQGDVPKPQAMPLPFAYLSQQDRGDFAFAAHRNGRRYYPIDSREAAMIPQAGFVGYVNAADAEADGKKPATD